MNIYTAARDVQFKLSFTNWRASIEPGYSRTAPLRERLPYESYGNSSQLTKFVAVNQSVAGGLQTPQTGAYTGLTWLWDATVIFAPANLTAPVSMVS
jgi:hypothetical protein